MTHLFSSLLYKFQHISLSIKLNNSVLLCKNVSFFFKKKNTFLARGISSMLLIVWLAKPTLEDSSPSCPFVTRLRRVFIYSTDAKARSETENRLHTTIPHWRNSRSFESKCRNSTSFQTLDGKAAGSGRSDIRASLSLLHASRCLQPLILTADANSLKNVPTKHLHLNKWKKVIF